MTEHPAAASRVASVGHNDFSDFYAAHMAVVVGLLISLGAERHDAEEIAQDAFAKLYVRWRRIRRYDNPGAWVRRVAVNE